jgi:hypothetical protein
MPSSTAGFSATQTFQWWECGPISAEALRAVCELVLTEVLVTQRGVARVLRLRLGSSIAGRHAFQLEWLPASQYGQPAAPRMLRGEVAL